MERVASYSGSGGVTSWRGRAGEESREKLWGRRRGAWGEHEEGRNLARRAGVPGISERKRIGDIWRRTGQGGGGERAE
jgi:hypothetical protein